MLAHSFLIKSSSKLLVTRTGIKARMSLILVLWFPWPIYMFFEMRFDLGTLDSGERSLPFGLLVSFFYLSNFQTLKFFRPFSGTVRPRRLKLGTHLDSGQMYRVYGIRLLLLICSFIFSFFFLSNFQTLKIFVTLCSGTVRPRRLKLGTHVDIGQMYGVYQNPAAAAYSSLYFFIFLSLQFFSIEIFCQFFLRNCEA